MSEFDPSQTDVVICTDRKLTHLADGVRVAREQTTDPESEDYVQYTLDEILEAVPSIVGGNLDKFVFEYDGVTGQATYVNIYSKAEADVVVPYMHCKNIILPNVVSMNDKGWWRGSANAAPYILPQNYMRENDPDTTYYFYTPNLKNVCYDPNTDTWLGDPLFGGTVFGDNCKYNIDNLEHVYRIGDGSASTSTMSFNVKTLNAPKLKTVRSSLYYSSSSSYASILKSIYAPNLYLDYCHPSNQAHRFQHLPNLKNVYLPGLKWVTETPDWRQELFSHCDALEELCLWSFSSSIFSDNKCRTSIIPGATAANLKRIIFPGEYFNITGSSGGFTNIRNHFSSPDYKPSEDPGEWGMFVSDDVYDDYKSSATTNGWTNFWNDSHIIKKISQLPAGLIDKYRPGRTFDQFMQDFNIPASEDPRMGLLTEQEIDDLYHDRYNPN